MPLTLQDLARASLEHRLLALIVFALCVLAIDFLLRFCIPALGLFRSLTRICQFLRSHEASRQAGGDLPAMIRDAPGAVVFAPPWNEYSKTLHAQREIDGDGRQRILRWRATALAETFFTEQRLVNSPLRTEYFKHLPGILTGIGIIGTFRGLIQGLRGFLPSLDPRLMQEALSTLIRVVGDAFLTSAAAIILAILFTLIEKFLLNQCYRKVEAIQQAIDRLFHAGVGEEYLERLVRASETSATQALYIKDALVSDLKQILAEVTTRQVEASARDSREVSSHVAEVIVNHLSAPMMSIAEAVKCVGSNQGDAIHSMLADVLVRFSDQLHAMFGEQVNGIGNALAKTMKAIEETGSRMEQLAASMDAAGKSNTNALAEQLLGALASLGAQQELLNRHNTESVEQLKLLVAHSQTESGEKLQQTLAHLGQQVVAVVGQLHEQSRVSIERQRDAGERFAGEMVSGLSREIENLMRQSSETSRFLLGSMDSLAETTHDSIARIASGAELLHVAASDFARAGQSAAASVNGTMDIFNDYKKNRDAFAVMVSELKVILQNAKKEAFMTSDLVEKLEAAAAQLARAQKQSEDYLAGVNEVLTRTHASFAENMERTLNHGNARFHGEMAKAVDLLAGGVRGLGHAVEMASLRS